MSISLLGLVLSFRSSILGRRSVRCLCSKVTILCGVVSVTNCLTGWVDRSRSSLLNICIACVGIVGNFIVRVRVCNSSSIVFVAIVGSIRFILGWVFSSFKLAGLVPIVTCLFAKAASWFGLLRVLLCSLLRHSVFLKFIWGFLTIQFQLLFKMRHNLFICAVLQTRLVD